MDPIHHFNTFPDFRRSLQERNTIASFDCFSSSEHIMPHAASLLTQISDYRLNSKAPFKAESQAFTEDDEFSASYS